MANGMASLMVGASGLKTSQTALNTTAHNLSNVNTTGYTRQQITFADSTYVNVFGTGNSTGKCGLGVDVDAISRIRNDFPVLIERQMKQLHVNGWLVLCMELFFMER